MREMRPRNVKEMLVEAKNTSELMVDLAYAAIFYNSEDLSEEVSSRVRVHADSALDGRSLGEVDLPVETGMRPIAIRSEDEWNFDPEPEDVLRAGDVLFLQGPPEGVTEVRELAGARPLGDDPE